MEPAAQKQARSWNKAGTSAGHTNLLLRPMPLFSWNQDTGLCGEQPSREGQSLVLVVQTQRASILPFSFMKCNLVGFATLVSHRGPLFSRHSSPAFTPHASHAAGSWGDEDRDSAGPQADYPTTSSSAQGHVPLSSSRL